MFSQRRSHYWSQQSRMYSTTCCIVALRHDDFKWNLLERSFSLKGLVQSSKKAKEKTNHYSVIEQNALSDSYMENIITCSHPKMTGKTRVWPVKSTIRPDIVRWPAVILSPKLPKGNYLVSQKIISRNWSNVVSFATGRAKRAENWLQCTRLGALPATRGRQK